jgi:hypothetical protein
MSTLQRTLISSATLLLALTSNSPADGAIVTLIDSSTPGHYNAGIGTLLNGTDPAFPSVGDPVANPAEPDLSAAATELGGWLSVPPDLATAGSTWSATPVAIPSTWAITTETAIVYAFDSGPGGLSDVQLSIGVDNGILAWLNGVYVGGALRPGGAPAGEHLFDLGDLAAGTHYLQLLREDHGGVTGYNIELTGTERSSLPDAGSSMVLFGLALAGLSFYRRSAR